MIFIIIIKQPVKRMELICSK